MKAKRLSFTYRNCKLVHTALERVLADAGAYMANQGWTREAKEKGLFVNLSRLEWADLSAAARLVLFVEGALREGISVTVVMPLPYPSGNEKRTIDKSVLRRVRKSKKALDFLKYVEFDKALTCPHIPKHGQLLQILEDYDPIKSEAISPEEMKRFQREANLDDYSRAFTEDSKRFAHVFPFRWISESDDKEIGYALSKTMHFLAGIMQHRERGISSLDADALANVLFYELIQNVKQHASDGVKHCLVAAWCRDSAQLLVTDEYYDQERPFFQDWIEKNQFPFVDLAVGDSGRGIPQVLTPYFDKAKGQKEGVPENAISKEEQVLFWSLGRWTSSVDVSMKRGTRGLHRVHQLVKGYQGLFTLRAETVLAGWDHGATELQKSFCARALPRVPGTFLSVRLPSVGKYIIPVVSRPIETQNADFSIAKTLDVGEHGIDEQDQIAIRSRLANGPPHIDRCIICLLGKIPTSDRRKELVEKTLAQMTVLAEPGCLVLLAPNISPDELESYVISINDTKEAKERYGDVAFVPETYDIEYPTLVINRALQAIWVGVTANEAKLLTSLIRSENNHMTAADIEDLIPDKEQRHRTQMSFRKHSRLIKFEENGGLSLRFNVGNVLEVVVTHICARIYNGIEASGQMGVHYGLYRSPSLTVVDKWFEVERFLQNLEWFEFNSEVFDDLSRHRIPAEVIDNLRELENQAFTSSEELKRKVASLLSTKGQAEIAEQVEELIIEHLQETLGPHFALYALAIKVLRSDLLSSEVRSTYVFGDSNAHAGSLEYLMEYLGAEKCIALPKSVSVGRIGDIWNIIDEAPVLVYCDILLTGNSLGQVLSQVIRNKGNPRLVACLVDGRSEDEQGCSVNWLGLEFPVVSLVQRSLSAPSDRMQKGVADIDPVTNRPVQGNIQRIELHYRIDHNIMKQWIEETKALHFSHIARPVGRHFTFYLDASKLLERNEIHSAIEKEVGEWAKLSETSIKDTSRIKVVYPAGGWPGAAQLLARELCKRLKFGDAEEIQRDPISGNWVFPVSLTRTNKHVVVVDWGAMTGTTITQLIRLAAESGAKSVLAVVCLSQLRQEEEEFLRSLSQINVSHKSARTRNGYLFTIDYAEPKKENKNKIQQYQIPVRVRFISSVKMRGYDEHECPVCQQLQRIRVESMDYPTSYLMKFAREQTEILGPKDREIVLKEKLKDIFGARLKGQDTVYMASFREQLEAALRWTSAREEVRGRLLDILAGLKVGKTDCSIEAQRILCFFATELHWLKLPPLRFIFLRDVLAEIANHVLESNAPDYILRHAIIVLRSASKPKFAESFGGLVSRFVEKPLVLTQLLYDAFTFVNRPYHQSPKILGPLVRGLRECEAILGKQLRATAKEFSPILSTAYTLHAIGNRRLGVSESRDVKRTKAWGMLRRFLNQEHLFTHNRLSKVVLAMSFGAFEKHWRDENIPIGNKLRWEEARSKWAKCLTHLERNMFPYIARTWQVYTGQYGKRFWGEEDLEILNELCHLRNSPFLQKISSWLESFSIRPPDAEGKDWKEFAQARDWIIAALLLPPWDKGGQSARLLEFVMGCPCELVSTVESFCSTDRWKHLANIEFGKKPRYECQVFCHKELILEILEEIFENAAIKHKLPSRIEPVDIEISVSPDPAETTKIYLLVKDRGTDPDYPPKPEDGPQLRGIEYLDELLKPYGGNIEHQKPPDAEWDYQTLVTFILGDVS